MQKVTTRTPSQEASRFFKPRISPPQPQLRTATIKTFVRKFRGFANLETAHTNNNLAQNKLKSFFRLTAVFLPGRHTPCSFLRPRRLFFPPYGGAMLLPQRFFCRSCGKRKTGAVKTPFLQLRFFSGHRPAGSAAIDKIIVARDERRLVRRNE